MGALIKTPTYPQRSVIRYIGFILYTAYAAVTPAVYVYTYVYILYILIPHFYNEVSAYIINLLCLYSSLYTHI